MYSNCSKCGRKGYELPKCYYCQKPFCCSDFYHCQHCPSIICVPCYNANFVVPYYSCGAHSKICQKCNSRKVCVICANHCCIVCSKLICNLCERKCDSCNKLYCTQCLEKCSLCTQAKFNCCSTKCEICKTDVCKLCFAKGGICCQKLKCQNFITN